jgi:flagellin-like protein
MSQVTQDGRRENNDNLIEFEYEQTGDQKKSRLNVNGVIALLVFLVIVFILAFLYNNKQFLDKMPGSNGGSQAAPSADKSISPKKKHITSEKDRSGQDRSDS